jgi:hypothetical protein
MQVVVIKRKPKILARMFMRFQEFYESPEFRGKIFTKKQFLDWYAKERKTVYEEDWAGFNLPGWVIEVFRHGSFNPLSIEEKRLLSMCKNHSGSFYVIGTENGDMRVLEHELAHALFYLDPVYKKKVIGLLNKIPKASRDNMKKWLKSKGYHQSVFIDEMQAYVISDKPAFIDKNLAKKIKDLFKLRSKRLNVV